jgi:hypothetical protein
MRKRWFILFLVVLTVLLLAQVERRFIHEPIEQEEELAEAVIEKFEKEMEEGIEVIAAEEIEKEVQAEEAEEEIKEEVAAKLSLAEKLAPYPRPEQTTTNLLALDPADYSYLQRKKQKESYNQLTEMLNPEMFEAYEGSKTWEELKAGDGSPLSFTLKSDWIVSDSDKPTAGLTVQKNSDTGDFEISGAEVFLPNSGFGMSIEEDKDSNKTKAYFKVKKEF